MTKKNRMKIFWDRVLDILLPPLCLGCESRVSRQHTLCPACWKSVKFITRPFCEQCGFPFEFPVENEPLCGRCLKEKPDFDRARSVLTYEDCSRRIILGLKHGDKTWSAPGIARLMVETGRDMWDTADYIVPVPLHRWRLWKRRFNQSALLGREIARRAGKSFVPDLLIRHKRTRPQSGNAKARRKNITGAFKLNPRWAGKIEGKRILIIDDVYTTGATVNACARVLKKNGAEIVNVLTLARVA
jgi:ComF family protein